MAIKIAARQGIDLPTGKLARWLILLVPLMQPLFNLLKEALISYDVTQIDATGLQVLDEPDRRGESKSYFWIRRGGPPDKPVVLVNYEPSKSADTVWRLLDQTWGYLVCDAAKEFDLSIERGGLSVVYSNDHARRKFDQVIKAAKDKTKTKDWAAAKAIGYYKKLYRIEREIADLSALEKHAQPQARAVPNWEEFIALANSELAMGIAHKRSREAFEFDQA